MAFDSNTGGTSIVRKTNISSAKDELSKMHSKKQELSANQAALTFSTGDYSETGDFDVLFDDAILHREEAFLREQLEANKPRGGKFIIRIKETSYVREETGEESCLIDSEYLTDVEEIFASSIEFREYLTDGIKPVGVQLHHGNGHTSGEYDAPGDYIMKPGEKISYETHGTFEEDHIILPFRSMYEVELFDWSDELFAKCFRVL